MDNEIKKMLVNALVEVVDSAPLRNNGNSNYLKGSKFISTKKGIGIAQRKGTEYIIVKVIPKSTLNPNHEKKTSRLGSVNREKEFKTWMGYVNKTMHTTSRYVNKNIFDSAQKNIQEIVKKPEQNYATKTNDVCKVVLEYARNIADL